MLDNLLIKSLKKQINQKTSLSENLTKIIVTLVEMLEIQKKETKEAQNNFRYAIVIAITIGGLSLVITSINIILNIVSKGG